MTMSQPATTPGTTPARALAMSTIAFTVCFAVWTIFSIIGVRIKDELGLTETQFGLLVGTPILTGSLVRMMLGIWTDRYGGRLVYTATMLAAAAATFLLSYARETLQPMITIENHVGFILKFTLAFGLVFELPLMLTILSRMGVVTPKMLARNRKYAILGAFVVAAILTPTPDMFNQSLMAGPLILLYEVGIVCARVFGRRRSPAIAQAEVSGS